MSWTLSLIKSTTQQPRSGRHPSTSASPLRSRHYASPPHLHHRSQKAAPPARAQSQPRLRFLPSRRQPPTSRYARKTAPLLTCVPHSPAPPLIPGRIPLPNMYSDGVGSLRCDHHLSVCALSSPAVSILLIWAAHQLNPHRSLAGLVVFHHRALASPRAPRLRVTHDACPGPNRAWPARAESTHDLGGVMLGTFFAIVSLASLTRNAHPGGEPSRPALLT